MLFLTDYIDSTYTMIDFKIKSQLIQMILPIEYFIANVSCSHDRPLGVGF